MSFLPASNHCGTVRIVLYCDKKKRTVSVDECESGKFADDLLVMLFNEILDVEQKALITGTFKEISINDMHIIDAIGIGEPKNMSTVAGEMAVTVGTLTTAINNLDKKGVCVSCPQ